MVPAKQTTVVPPSRHSYYQAELIYTKLICPNCEERYVNPLNMPCSHNICLNCFKTLKTELSESIECPVCHLDNPIPKDKGFPINYLLTELLDLETVEVKRGKNFEHLIDSTSELLMQLNQLIAELNDKLYSSEEKINASCSDLREQINLAANTKIEQLNKFRETFLERINEYQKKCLENLENNLKNEKKELVDKSFLDLDEWKTTIGLPSSDEREIENIKVLAENLKSKLEREKFSHDLMLFGKERWRFIQDTHDLVAESIGKIQIESIQSEDLTEEGRNTI